MGTKVARKPDHLTSEEIERFHQAEKALKDRYNLTAFSFFKDGSGRGEVGDWNLAEGVLGMTYDEAYDELQKEHIRMHYGIGGKVGSPER